MYIYLIGSCFDGGSENAKKSQRGWYLGRGFKPGFVAYEAALLFNRHMALSDRCTRVVKITPLPLYPPVTTLVPTE
jgi:hypothetical protein